MPVNYVGTVFPHSTGAQFGAAEALNDNLEHDVLDVNGKGKTVYVVLMSNAANMSEQNYWRIYCDGNEALTYDHMTVNALGFINATPGISTLLYAVNGACAILLTVEFSFLTNIRITCQRAVGAANQNVVAYGVINH